ncbi:MAG: UDP-N-acetylmuramoyl-L-alanine--D-glutamate ligase [Acidobacteriota bacterium]|nr:UDP-N-acetylmuramoyl-L-alanine--D-glutamate ligase [Acidobacteriota bacterium]
MDLKNKRVLVLGLAKSGIASTLFLKSRGANVTVSDVKPPEQFGDEIPLLLSQGIVVETGGHAEHTIQNQDLVVVSPGVPRDAPSLLLARESGISVIGEIELAAQFMSGSIIAITGSNGKTTTTTLVGKILKAAGFPVLVGGNIGTPAISLADQTTPKSLVVLEVSSFQLETIQIFRPKIAVILNITPDHLDRHRTLSAYTNAKARIFENQKLEDFTVLNADDPICVQLASRTRSQVFWFSRKKEVKAGAYVVDGTLVCRDSSGVSEIMPVSEIPLKGGHNQENILASVCACVLVGSARDKIREAVRDFHAVEHRLEFVATIRGVSYYNDSKATNVDATIKALESFPANIHLILGGKDKDSDYSLLRDLLRERVKCVYTIGAAAAKIESQIKGASEVIQAGNLNSAVIRAALDAQSGDIVLLAPACASFDQFQSYEHRGRIFKEAVAALTRAEHSANNSSEPRK